MMEYKKTDDDFEFRRIDLNSIKNSEYIPFSNVGPIITFGNDVVLEVKKKDGSEQLIYPSQRKEICYSIHRPNCSINPCPLARVWLKDLRTGMLYKLPTSLSKNEYTNRFLFCLNADPEQVALCGDKYFEMAYILKKS